MKHEARTVLIVGRALAMRGQGAEAGALYHAALLEVPRCGPQRLRSACLAGLAEVALGQSEAAEAHAYAEEVFGSIAQLQSDGVMEPLEVAVVCYQA